VPGPSLIGLTGGVAAGKSEALRILSELGAATLSTDAVVHDLLGTEAVRDRIVERWGPELAPGGELDRGQIAAIVFDRPEELTWPEWRRSLPDDLAVAVVEVPLLFEGGMADIFDATVAVVADEGVRARRAAERGTGKLEARDSRQLSQEEKAERATHVVTNVGTVEELEARLAAMFWELEAAGG
jgi:dephospho-CoA kinase